MSESSSHEVSGFNAKITVPDRAFAFSFFQQDFIEDGDQAFSGDIHDKTGITYPEGEVYDEERLKVKFGENSTLFRNVIGNGYAHAVKARAGNFQPLVEGDTVTDKEGNIIFPAS